MAYATGIAFLTDREVYGCAICADCDWRRDATSEHKDSHQAGRRGPVGLVLYAAQRHARDYEHRVTFYRTRVDHYDGTQPVSTGKVRADAVS